MKKLYTGLSIALSVMVIAQKVPAKKAPLELYTYQTFGCDVKGYFDPSKYKKEEIDGTYQLLSPLTWSPFTSLIVFNPVKYDKVRSNSTQLLQQAEKEYLKRKKELEGLKLINLPIWKKQQEEALILLENEYQLNKALLLGYADPQSLQSSKFYNTCKEYADAMTTKDKEKMYSVWKSLFETKKGEEDYSGTQNAFNAKWNDPRKDDYAIIDLMNAFNNCANHSFRTKADEENTVFKTFEKVFVKLKRDCDEP
ncbi:hypothetical protein BBH99_13830 [Chryseobacterium contaminans]|uniref:Uncharacterized protein n=1 Tax=Chryseobacterium contaminans TaxID=1423959 RepID=A0A1M7BYK3_9FLAO|nr:hypothetical protein [Chryseobacterium contaminans]OCA71062.1 hypothetical protein BBH99_13830 [Chryseobacterium contaminans]SHL60085.1 hypothetical protein SAMN05444407_10520 [Chryseobacterium contaminans]